MKKSIKINSTIPTKAVILLIFLILGLKEQVNCFHFQRTSRQNGHTSSAAVAVSPRQEQSSLFFSRRRYSISSHPHSVPYSNSLSVITQCRGGAATGPLHSTVLSLVDDFFVTAPYLAAAITCGTKASAADFVAQRRQLKKRGDDRSRQDDAQATTKKFEIARNIAFLIYGAVYQGMGQEYIYNHLYPLWFGSGTAPLTVLTKVLFDLLIQTTLVTLPIAYLTKAAIFRYSITEAMRRYYEDIVSHGLLIKYFALWGPVQCFTFSIVPEHFRVAFIAVVSFFWLIILSTISAKPRANTKQSVTIIVPKGGDKGSGSEGQKYQQPEECSYVDGMTCNIDG